MKKQETLTDAIETAENITVGTQVLVQGYPGTVIEVCSWNTNLVEIRLARGTVCLPKSNFTGSDENNKVL